MQGLQVLDRLGQRFKCVYVMLGEIMFCGVSLAPVLYTGLKCIGDAVAFKVRFTRLLCPDHSFVDM